MFLESLIFLSISALMYNWAQDEEPGLDYTDISSVHVGLFGLVLFCVFVECTFRSKQGVGGQKDRVVYSYAFVKSNFLVAYFFFIWGVFAAHLIFPLIIENLIVSNDFVVTYFCWVGRFLLLQICFLIVSSFVLRSGSRVFGVVGLGVLFSLAACSLVWIIILLIEVSSLRNSMNLVRGSWVMGSLDYTPGVDFIWHSAMHLSDARVFLDFVMLFFMIFGLVFVSTLFVCVWAITILLFEDCVLTRGVLVSIISACEAIVAVSLLFTLCTISFFWAAVLI